MKILKVFSFLLDNGNTIADTETPTRVRVRLSHTSLKVHCVIFYSHLVVKFEIALKRRLLSSALRFETMAGGMRQDSRSYDNNMARMRRRAFCPSRQSIDRKNMAASVELTRPM